MINLKELGVHTIYILENIANISDFKFCGYPDLISKLCALIQELKTENAKLHDEIKESSKKKNDLIMEWHMIQANSRELHNIKASLEKELSEARTEHAAEIKEMSLFFKDEILTLKLKLCEEIISKSETKRKPFNIYQLNA